MPEIRVHLFGYPRVECDGAPIAVPRRKALALLAYLAVTQSHHSRDVLASLLWPEEESTKAYAFLRNALWVLHQTPLEPWIVATRHMVGLRVDDGLWIDATEFRRLVRTCRRHKHPESELCDEGVADLQAAADLAQDGFLAGFVAEDSRSFEEWQFGEADVLAQELAQTFERLSEHFERAGDGHAALRCAQRLLSGRTLDEPAYRRVMRLQVKSGDRAAALHTFDDCVRILDEELSLSPSDETRTLADDIRSRAAATAPVRPVAAPSTAHPALPSYRLPVVGREEDVAQVLSLLAAGDSRLVTLTGTGGSGKTRLAVEVAEHAAQFSDGALFVPLADVDSPSLVPAAILSALGEVAGPRAGASGSEGETYLQETARHIGDRDLLIVLDNIEQLARDPRWLEHLVRRTRRPRFLATSRQELGVPGELVYPLEGLRVPPSMGTSSATQFGAVQLFLQAARRADGRFSPTADDTRSIAAIVRHLGGNPLAIELAAAWVRTMSCAAIEAEILRSVDFLKTDRKLLPRRHRSLRAAFEGSWSLLDRDGRAAFRALSVFRGGFTPESAFRVAGVTLPSLASLVAKSLLERRGADRYEMLEVVREYANERLLAVPDEAAAAHDQHADYFLALLASQETRLKGAEQAKAIALLALDETNLAAAWRHAALAGPTNELARAAMGLFLFCDMTSRFAAGRELFRLATSAKAPRTPDAARNRAYLGGIEAWFAGFIDPRTAKSLFERALADAAPLRLDRDLAFVRILAAFSTTRIGAPLASQASEALAFFEKHAHDWECGAAYEALTGAESSPRKALKLAQKSTAIRQAIGDHWGVALGRYTEATILESMGDLGGAVEGFAASADLRRELDLDPAGLALCLVHLGKLKHDLRRVAKARRDLEEGAKIAGQIGYPLAVAAAFEQLAILEAAAHRPAVSRRHAKSAADAYRTAGFAERAANVGRVVRERTGSSEPGTS